jgi:glycosyltransferase involved in cell wall biosynthesis
MNPKLSIVTINLNNASGLESTIKSVIQSNFKDFEFIIVDGESNDDSVEIIKKYEEKIDLWISERDNGIYDAMNKGILLSSGDYIHLLNSGDLYANPYTLDFLSEADNRDFYCFSVLKKRGNRTNFVWKPKVSRFENYVNVSHPGLIVNRKIYEKEMYTTKFRIVSDSLFIYRNVKPDRTIIINQVLVQMQNAGISSKFSLQQEFEVLKAIFDYGYLKKTWFIYLFKRYLSKIVQLILR